MSFPLTLIFCCLCSLSAALCLWTLDKCPLNLAFLKFKTLWEMCKDPFWSCFDMIWNWVEPWISCLSFTLFTFLFLLEVSKLRKSGVSSVSSSSSSSSTNSVLTGTFSDLAAWLFVSKVSGNWSKMSSEGALAFSSSSLAFFSSFCCLKRSRKRPINQAKIRFYFKFNSL